MEASEPKWVNPNDSFRLGGLQLSYLYLKACKTKWGYFNWILNGSFVILPYRTWFFRMFVKYWFKIKKNILVKTIRGFQEKMCFCGVNERVNIFQCHLNDTFWNDNLSGEEKVNHSYRKNTSLLQVMIHHCVLTINIIIYLYFFLHLHALKRMSRYFDKISIKFIKMNF